LLAQIGAVCMGGSCLTMCMVLPKLQSVRVVNMQSTSSPFQQCPTELQSLVNGRGQCESIPISMTTSSFRTLRTRKSHAKVSISPANLRSHLKLFLTFCSSTPTKVAFIRAGQKPYAVWSLCRTSVLVDLRKMMNRWSSLSLSHLSPWIREYCDYLVRHYWT
jgi:hypothetical protein